MWPIGGTPAYGSNVAFPAGCSPLNSTNNLVTLKYWRLTFECFELIWNELISCFPIIHELLQVAFQSAEELVIWSICQLKLLYHLLNLLVDHGLLNNLVRCDIIWRHLGLPGIWLRLELRRRHILRVHFSICQVIRLAHRQFCQILVELPPTSFFIGPWGLNFLFRNILVILNSQFFLLRSHERRHEIIDLKLRQLLVNDLSFLNRSPFGLLIWALLASNWISMVLISNDIFDFWFLQEWEVFGQELIRIFWLQIDQLVTRLDLALKLWVVFAPFYLTILKYHGNMIVRHFLP